jgi:hypothetical protein
MSQIETNLTAYTGNMSATTYEATGPGPQFAPTNVIRLDQPWGVKVKWLMTGQLTKWLNANFHLNVVLERIGPGADIALPTKVVNSLTGTVGVDGIGTPTRSYDEDIKVLAGGVPEGIYRVVTTLHLFDNLAGQPTPIAGFSDSGMISIFKPKP